MKRRYFIGKFIYFNERGKRFDMFSEVCLIFSNLFLFRGFFLFKVEIGIFRF